MSESHTGENNPCYGKHKSNEQRMKISTSKKGKKWTIARILAQENRNKILNKIVA